MAVILDTGSPSKPTLAIAARFYYPAGDSRTSYHQVYLCDIHGKNRRQLTHGETEHYGVYWIGRDKLAWIESTRVSKVETSIGFHDDEGAPHKLVEYDINTRKSRTVAVGEINTGSDWREAVRYPRGQAVYQVYKTPSDLMADENATLYAVKSGRLTQVKSAPATLYKGRPDSENNYGPERAFWQSGLEAKVVISDQIVKTGFRGGGYEEGQATTVTWKGHTVTLPVSDIDFVWPSKKRNVWWLKSGSYAGSAGSDMFVYEYNWKTHKTRLIANDVLSLDFEGDKRYWAASSNNKYVTNLGKLTVWQRELWAGDCTTGKQWRIAAGAVHGTDARVRPD